MIEKRCPFCNYLSIFDTEKITRYFCAGCKRFVDEEEPKQYISWLLPKEVMTDSLVNNLRDIQGECQVVELLDSSRISFYYFPCEKFILAHRIESIMKKNQIDYNYYYHVIDYLKGK